MQSQLNGEVHLARALCGNGHVERARFFLNAAARFDRKWCNFNKDLLFLSLSPNRRRGWFAGTYVYTHQYSSQLHVHHHRLPCLPLPSPAQRNLLVLRCLTTSLGDDHHNTKVRSAGCRWVVPVEHWVGDGRCRRLLASVQWLFKITCPGLSEEFPIIIIVIIIILYSGRGSCVCSWSVKGAVTGICEKSFISTQARRRRTMDEWVRVEVCGQCRLSVDWIEFID